MKDWRIVAVLLLCLVLAGSTACGLFGDNDEEEVSQQLVEVVRDDLIVSISGSGDIQVANEAKLTFGVGGRIDRIYVEESDTVTEGDVLAKLDTGALELALTQASVAVTMAQLDSSASELALTQAQLNVNASELAVTQAQLDVDASELAVTLAQLDVDASEMALTQAKLDGDASELALTKAELALKEAEYNLDEANEPYTEQDISNAEAAVDEAEYYLEYAQWALERATLLREKRDCQYWVYNAVTNLGIAERNLDEMLSAPDEDEIVILEMGVEVAKQSLGQAQKQVDASKQSLEQAQKQVDASKQSLEQAQKKVDISKQSLEQAQKRVDASKQSLEQAQQSLEQAQKQLDEATITASFDGMVASVDADEEDTVSSAKTIIHLIDLSTMELNVEVDEIDIAGVKPGQRAIIEVDALPDLELEGEVTFISPLGRGEAGVVLYEVKISFNVPEDLGLRAGMSTEADIVINERNNVLLVPDRAIKQDSQGNSMVEVMVDEQIQQRSVVTGISDGFQTEIVSGLDEGETVVVERRAKPKPTGMGCALAE